MGYSGAVKIERITRSEVLGRNPVVVLTHKRFTGAGLLARQPLAHPRAHAVDELRLHVRCPHSHLDTAFSLFLGPISLARLAPFRAES